MRTPTPLSKRGVSTTPAPPQRRQRKPAIDMSILWGISDLSGSRCSEPGNEDAEKGVANGWMSVFIVRARNGLLNYCQFSIPRDKK